MRILKISRENLINQSEIEELEQIGRRKHLRFEAAASEQTETSEKVLSKVMDMCGKTGAHVPDTVTDRAHWIGEAYLDNKRRNNGHIIIFCFATFRHRTMVYSAKKNMKNNVRFKLELIFFQEISLF